MAGNSEKRNMLIIYTLEHCPKCKILTSYLRLMNIEFEEKNAQDFISYLTNQGFYSTPILEIDGELFDFTSAKQVTLILHRHGYPV